MRFRLPDDCAGVVLAGVSLAPDADGTIEADEGAAVALAPHEIRPVGEVAPPEAQPKRAGRTRSDDRRMLR